MGMQCAMGAMTAGAAATGLRAWSAHLRRRWPSARRLRVLTVALVGAGLVASAAVPG